MTASSTINDKVYDGLKKAILNGYFKPGDSITLRQLAKEFGTSPMPVREAIKRLKTENTIEVTPTRRLRIPFVTRKKLNEIYRARLIIEGTIIREAARIATPKQIENLKEIQKEIRSEGQKDLRDKKGGSTSHSYTISAHTRFHFALYEVAQNSTLLPLIESLWLQYAPALAQCALVELKQLSYGDLKNNYELLNNMHTQIIEALSDRNEDLAEKVLCADITAFDRIADALGLPEETNKSERKLVDYLT